MTLPLFHRRPVVVRLLAIVPPFMFFGGFQDGLANAHVGAAAAEVAAEAFFTLVWSGWDARSRKPLAAMTKPGVQYPHCWASLLTNAAETG